MARRRKHDVADNGVALAYIRCTCGWENRIEYLKGKTDEDLARETGQAFIEHQTAEE